MGHIEIRNVPDDLHRTLKARAAERGMTLSAYMLEKVCRPAAHETTPELVKWVRKGKLIGPKMSSTEIIRRIRDASSAP